MPNSASRTTPFRAPPSNWQMEIAFIPSLRLRSTAIRFITLIGLTLIALTIGAAFLAADPVPVVQRQGAVHGFLLMKDENGKDIAVGDQTNEVRGNLIHARTVFQFRDGSVDDEETTYRQGSTFELILDHHVQKGPAFSKPSDVTVDVRKGEVSWIDLSGKDKQPKNQHMHLPRDLANGMIPLLVQNFPQGAANLKVSYLAVDSKPRLIKLDIKPDGIDKVALGWIGRQADKFDVHFDLGGIAGAVAPLIGKQPPDINVWTLDGSAGPVPEFVKLVGPLYQNGPTWTVLLAAPTWPTADQKPTEDQKK